MLDGIQIIVETERMGYESLALVIGDAQRG